MSELVVDNFAGGGGASTGIESAVGQVHLAFNHDPEALTMHRANHRGTKHFCENILKVDPALACAGRPVGMAWFSPDCTHFSKAKGGKPKSKEIRGLAWVVVRWIKAVAPRVIFLENVEEFQDWGPLGEDGMPIKSQRGDTFREWVQTIRSLGYAVEWRVLVASSYGAPTIRKRLFLVARRDGLPIVWPGATHGAGLADVRTAAECIDWSLPCPSIFTRKRPLVEATMARIARGIQRFVVDDPEPFIVRTGHAWKGGKEPGGWRGQSLQQPLATICATNDKNLVFPFMVKHYGSRRHGASIKDPMPTITGGGQHVSLYAAFIAKHFGGMTGVRADTPFPTITQKGCQNQAVQASLLRYNGTNTGQRMQLPLGTITSRDRFGLVTVAGQKYQIVDIGMRMLQPRELFNAQGFPDGYEIAPMHEGKILTKTAQIRLVGNSVCPSVARALVEANFSPRQANAHRNTA